MFGSKAGTLALLAGRLRHGRVPDSLVFTAREWSEAPSAVRGRIRRRFGPVALAVRSCAWGEDSLTRTHAGRYRSCLHVPGWDERALSEAVEAVIAHYDQHPENRVLVQPMVLNARLLGVVSTHCIPDAAPYYAISVDEWGRPNTVTAGTGPVTTTLVYRDAWRSHLGPHRLRALMTAVEEVESLCPPAPLEIEWALPVEGVPVILQVRPLTAALTGRNTGASFIDRQLADLAATIEGLNSERPGLSGARTLLGAMPDWNPAEAIGARPRPLALSLYEALIGRSAWRRARGLMGYRPLPGVNLLMGLGGRPYVDVRASFNSFLPRTLGGRAATLLVDAWLDRLERRPWLHDKVEFEVAQTCLDLDFDAVYAERYPGLLPRPAYLAWREALRGLTRACLAGCGPGTLARAGLAIRRLSQRSLIGAAGAGPAGAGPSGVEPLLRLLRECRDLGTVPFACAARHAFIAESLLRSAVRLGALSPGRAAEFRRSVRTVSGKMASDRWSVDRGLLPAARFQARYGHLRPGTYDIRSPRYADTPAFFESASEAREVCPAPRFALTGRERRDLDRLLAESRLDGIGAAGVLRYARRAITLRERAKFVFTRHISALLEAVAEWGWTLGFGREDLSYLTLEDIARLGSLSPGRQRPRLEETLVARREAFHATDAVKLSPLIVWPGDVYCFTQMRSVPNFIGAGSIRASVVCLDAGYWPGSVRGRAVCVESADPGFDWIFAQGAAGLVTQYGGPNSHMAVRCAELGLPAALGCGESLYRNVRDSAEVMLDCEAHLVVPHGGGHGACASA